jgi:integrase
MATFKALIRKGEKRADGTWNVKIRVTHNREYKLISTPFYVDQSQITKGFVIKDAAVISKVEQKIAEYRDRVVSMGFAVNDMSILELVGSLEKKQERVDFIAFMWDYIANLRLTKRINTANIYATAATSLYKYNRERPLYCQDITAKYIRDYFSSIQHLKNNTIRSYIISIRTMYKAAQLQYNDDDAGIINVRHGVFKLIELPPQTESDKETLTSKQIQAIIDTPYTGTWYCDFIKDMFLLSFMLFGTNANDLFFAKKSQYQDGILTYRRQKISRRKGKKAEIQIKVPEPAKVILEKYSGDKEYLIDFCGRSRSIAVCRYIHATFQNAGIEPKGDYLSRSGHTAGEYVFYANRHAMATIAINECGIDYMTVHSMLNHSVPQSFQTTDVYIKRDFSSLWEANEKLLSIFDWSFYLNQREPL